MTNRIQFNNWKNRYATALEIEYKQWYQTGTLHDYMKSEYIKEVKNSDFSEKDKELLYKSINW